MPARLLCRDRRGSQQGSFESIRKAYCGETSRDARNDLSRADATAQLLRACPSIPVFRRPTARAWLEPAQALAHSFGIRPGAQRRFVIGSGWIV